jgi:hypothetical protein
MGGYAYAGDNPVTDADPTGQFAYPVDGSGVGHSPTGHSWPPAKPAPAPQNHTANSGGYFGILAASGFGSSGSSGVGCLVLYCPGDSGLNRSAVNYAVHHPDQSAYRSASSVKNGSTPLCHPGLNREPCIGPANKSSSVAEILARTAESSAVAGAAVTFTVVACEILLPSGLSTLCHMVVSGSGGFGTTLAAGGSVSVGIGSGVAAGAFSGPLTKFIKNYFVTKDGNFNKGGFENFANDVTSKFANASDNIKDGFNNFEQEFQESGGANPNAVNPTDYILNPAYDPAVIEGEIIAEADFFAAMDDE